MSWNPCNINKNRKAMTDTALYSQVFKIRAIVIRSWLIGSSFKNLKHLNIYFLSKPSYYKLNTWQDMTFPQVYACVGCIKCGRHCVRGRFDLEAWLPIYSTTALHSFFAMKQKPWGHPHTHCGSLSSYNSKLKAQHISDAENPKYLYVKDSGYLGQTFWNI